MLHSSLIKVLFVCLKYCFRLRSCQEGQFLNHTSWASLLEAVYENLVPILLPETDKQYSMKERHSEHPHTKMGHTAVSDAHTYKVELVIL